MDSYIMVFDQGTSSSRCILFNKKGQVVSIAQKELRQIYPKPGWVEHDPLEIWEAQIEVAHQAIHNAGVTYSDIATIGITNQRETTVIWDKKTGEPVYNALVWQCRRTANYCDELKAKGLTEYFRRKTGLYIDAYFSATKIKWVLDNIEGVRKRAEAGELLFGTIDTWLVWNLTKGKVHVTDYSNASRTMLFNIEELKWDDEILEKLTIPKTILPKVRPSSHIYGETDLDLFGASIPISSVVGDQQSALFGHGCLEKGMVKNTYGTGGFLLMNTGEEMVRSNSGLLTTIAWGVDGRVNYALEGSIFVAGAAIQWLRDELEIIEDSSESETLAKQVSDNNGVYFVPAFVGLGAPYWNPYARGTILGLTRGTNKNHIARAALESIAYQTYDVLKAMEKDSEIQLSALKVDGGATSNNFLMQFQSDIINVPVERPTNKEITAFGAAKLAGLAVGYWDMKHDFIKEFKASKIFLPEINEQKRKKLLNGWHKAIQCTLKWVK